jgi:ribosomal protein S15P/S13E
MVEKETTKDKDASKLVETKKEKKLTQKEYEKKIQELAKDLTAEKIGQKLRDEGIHSKEYSGKISKILGDKYINPDLRNVEKKLEKVKTHYEKNKQDKRAKREKDRIFSQLRKLKKYFKIDIR